MAKLTFKPLVFVSSAIEGMRPARRQIREAIDKTGLADSWLFEFHATASGDGPDAQYLSRARSSDLFVIIVADSVSQATWAEYEAAFGDNPAKILPFFVGKATGSQRSTIADRHTYWTIESIDKAADAIRSAVEAAVLSGVMVRGPLQHLVREQLRQRRQLMGLPGDFEFPLLATVGSNSATEIGDLIKSNGHVVLRGPAGSGKTYGALRYLDSVDPAKSLSVYIRWPNVETPIEELIEKQLRAVRFSADRALIERWVSQGSVSLVVDGLDELSETTKEAALASIGDFSASSPRGQIVVASRDISPFSLPAFTRLDMAEVSDASLVSLLRHTGREIRGASDLPPRLREMARRPLWAGLLATSSLEVTSATDLIEALLRRHIDSILPNAPIERTVLRSALRVAALVDQANPGSSIETNVGAMGTWLDLKSTQARLQTHPATWYLENMAKSGLVQIDGEQIVFAHPLLSAYLAAEAYAKEDDVSHIGLSQDAHNFAAVMLSESDADRLLRLLESSDIFALASIARLVGPESRETSDLAHDLERFDVVFKCLASKVSRHGQVDATEWRTTALRHGDSTALRRSTNLAPRTSDGDDLAAWASVNQEPVRYTVWVGQPFRRQRPDFVAVGEIVWAFKTRMLDLQPEGSWFAPLSLGRASSSEWGRNIDQDLIAFAKTVRDHRLRLLTELNLLDHPLMHGRDGEPVITVFGDDENARYETAWGSSEPVVQRVPQRENAYLGQSISNIFSDADAFAWHELSEELERALESPLDSQSNSLPTMFPGWAL